MKRFIYLDTDELNSYIAQIYKGLSIEKEEVKEKKNNKEKEIDGEINTKLNIGAKIKALFNFNGEVSTNILEKNVKGESDVIKDIQKKIIHDEAFDNFLGYLEDKEMIKTDNYNVGDFIKRNSDFKIFDLNYFLNLFNENGFIDFLNKNNKKETDRILENEKNKLNREQRREKHYEIQKIEKQAYSDLKKQENEYDNIKNVINAIKSIMPYEKIILVDQFFLATDDKYFRDNPEMLGFKYGGKISFVGYITNIVGKEEKAMDGIDSLTGFKKIVNSTILNLISNKEILVVHPIAIYYE